MKKLFTAIQRMLVGLSLAVAKGLSSRRSLVGVSCSGSESFAAPTVKRNRRTAECPVDSQGVSASREFAERTQNSLKPRQPRDDRAMTERQNGTAKVYQGYSKGIRFAAAILVLLTIGVGEVWGAYSASFVRINSVSELSTGDSVLVVIQDAKTKTSGYAIQNNSTNYSAVTIATATNTITCTNQSCVWKVGKSSSNWYFQRGSQYIAWTSSTTLTATGTTSNTYTWTIADVSGYNGYLRIKNTGTGTRDIGWSGSKFAAYANSNYVNQMATSPAAELKQYDGAISIYKKGSSCSNSVTISKGTGTNCTFSLSKSGAQASCDGVATTVTVTPNTGYGTPVVTQSGASAAPTISGSGNSQTVTYAANTTGTSTINVSCSANNYTITLNNESSTTAGTTSITATYNASTNLTSAITKPTKTGWVFGGYYTAKNGGGTQIIDASGNVIASAGGGSTYTDASKNWKYANTITLYAKWTCTVTWSVNGSTSVYSAQTVTYNSAGCKVGSVPTISDLSDYCGDKFVGWTTEADVSQNNDTGLGLFTAVSGSPNITGDITFYAVFADYDD